MIHEYSRTVNIEPFTLRTQLWKSLYISEYGRLRLRGARGFIGRGDGREVKPLPGRAKAEDVRDWKWMFRISSNWRTGECLVQLLAACAGKPAGVGIDLYHYYRSLLSRAIRHWTLARSVFPKH